MSTLAPIWIPIQGIDKFSKQFAGIQKQVEKVGANFSKVGRTATMGLTVPIIAAATYATKSAMDINAAMANIATLIPGNTARVAELKTGIQDLSKETGKTAVDLSTGLYQVISAFGDTADSMQITSISAKAAAAGLSTTEEAVNLLSAVTKGYGDTTAAAVQQAADFAFQTVKLGQTTFPQLAESMGRTVPIANALNISQAELFATYATLTGVTGKASEVSTQLAAVMGSILKPTLEMSETVKSMGFESASAMMKEKGLVASIQLLNTKVKGNADAMAKMVGSKEALTAALALSGSQADVFTAKMAQMQQSTGVLTEAFKEQTTGINAAGFKTQQAMQSIATASQKMGDIILPVIAQVADFVGKLMDKLSSLPAPVMMTIVIMAGLAALIGPLALGISSLLTAFSGIMGVVAGAGGVMAVLGSVMAVILNPFVLIAVAVALLWDRLELLRAVVGGGLFIAFSFLAPILKTMGEFVGVLVSIASRLFIILSPIVAVLYMVGAAIISLPFAFLIKSFEGWLMILTPILKAVDWLLSKIELLTQKLGGFLSAWKKTGDETKKGFPAPSTPAQEAATFDAGRFNSTAIQDTPLDLSALSNGKRDESKVTIDFVNMAPGVKIIKEKGSVNLTSNNGAIMGGVL